MGSSHTSKKSISQSSSSMSTSMKSSSQTVTSSKKSVSSRNVQINVGSKKKSVAAMSSSSMAEERKLSKLLNPRGRKVTRQGDWLVFTEKVGILTSQRGPAGQGGEGQDQLRGPR